MHTNLSFKNFVNITLVDYIGDLLHLSVEEKDNFMHDINNGRGSLWLERIENELNAARYPQAIKLFKEVIKYEEAEGLENE